MKMRKTLIAAGLAAGMLASTSLVALANTDTASASGSASASISVGTTQTDTQTSNQSSAQSGAQTNGRANAHAQARGEAKAGLQRAQEAVAAALARLEAKGKAGIHLQAVLDRLAAVEAKQATEAEVKADAEETEARLSAEGKAEAAAEIKAAVETYLKARAELRSAIEAALEQEPANAELYQQASAAYQAEGSGKIHVFVQGKKPQFDVEPVIRNGRTLVPIRAIAESLDAQVDYDAQARVVIITRGDVTIRLPIDSKVATVNGQEVHLDVAATIENNRTIVPLRFVSQALNAEVNWDGAAKMVIILEKK